MGSLVMTTHATDFPPPQHHHIMVDSDSQDSQDSDREWRTRQRRDSTKDSPEQSERPPPQPHDNPNYSSSTSSDATITASSHPPSHASQQRYHPRNNPQNRAYDQSGFPLTSDPRALAQTIPSSPRLQPTYRSTQSLALSEATSPSRIKVRDLSHIQSFASEDFLARPRLHQRTASTFSESGRQFEISSMPVTDIIEMVAGLLTRITTTNDRQHEHVHRPIPPPEEQGNMTPQTSCVLAFHGKNVPSINILSYLSRIHKYCPTTYEVFLSLLIYFDRMTESVNRGFLKNMHNRNTMESDSTAAEDPSSSSATTPVPPPASPTTSRQRTDSANSHNSSHQPEDLSQFFVVDSFNIHRLVIAAVTCASKFFSDVFYTNSRYAKVGGLPLVELNHLELQFLILNDFRLSIPVEELEAYGTMLVEFYAREVVAQQQQQQVLNQQATSPRDSTPVTSPNTDGGMFMRDSTGPAGRSERGRGTERSGRDEEQGREREAKEEGE